MAFWFIILFAAGAAFLAFKKSDFYRMWAIGFNVFIAIYISVMLSQWIISMIPAGTPGIPYQIAGCIFVVAILVFGVLQAITVNFIILDREVTFPKLFDTIGAAVLGFVAGWFVAAFVLLLVSTMPFTKYPAFETLTGKKAADRLAVAPVVALCDFVTTISIQPPQGHPKMVVKKLVDPNSTVRDNTNKEPKTIKEIRDDLTTN